jgi:hypothetical protein
MKEVLEMLVAERLKFAEMRRRVRLAAKRLGWKAIKNGPSASLFLLKRTTELQERARSLSKLAGTETSDPLAAMRGAQARLETIEAVLAEYRKKFSSE